jgi:type IV secretion system protein VirD4
MDIKLNIAVGDDTTAKIVSGNLGRQYVEREGWGKAGGLLLSKQASQGRFELIPLMDPDAVLRLDDNSTILQIRGTYGAILNKLNFYTDEQFVDRRRQVAPHAARMPNPVLDLTPEWPLFQERPADHPTKLPLSHSMVPSSAFTRTVEPDAFKPSMDDEAADIIDLARKVYRNIDRFAQDYRDAVAAENNEQAAILIHKLRVQPDFYGHLVGTVATLDLKGRQERNRAMAAIQTLRSAIIQARRSVTEERARLYIVNQAQRQDPAATPMLTSMIEPLAISQPGTPLDNAAGLSPAESSSATVADPDDPFADHGLSNDLSANSLSEAASPVKIEPSPSDDDDEDDTRIDFGMATTAAAIASITALANGAAGRGQVSDIAKLSGALERISNSLEAAASDEPWTITSVQSTKSQRSNAA